ncbi:MAG: M23 family metallopeptidase [Phycisphaerae bacterium]|nr:M23 family metallopeptidase [Phycisphaerae bacterium]
MEATGPQLGMGCQRLVTGWLLWVVAISSAVASSAGVTSQSPVEDRPVKIDRVSGPGYASVFVENRRAYDVTVRLRITAPNATVEWRTSETAAYAGHSRTEAVRVRFDDPRGAWQWRYSFRWTKGSIDAKHDPRTLYRLPFETGHTYRVCQGYNGRFSHRGLDQYAVDFAMPEGTTVCAARDGVVVDVKETSNTGGPEVKYKRDSNYVSIAHADGTIGEYHHLQFEGVLVEIGDPIAAGQPIARSGNTGYSSIPHLHFGVYSAANAERMQSHPIALSTAEGIVTDPRPPRAYTAE